MDRLAKLVKRISPRQKKLLMLKILTTLLLFWTIGTLLLAPQVSLYLWALTLLASTTTVVYGIHTWLEEL